MEHIMDAQQFQDIPQIFESNYWAQSFNDYNASYRNYGVNFNIDNGAYFEHFDNGTVSMPPMERWMSDKSTFTPGMPHTKYQYQGQHDQYFEQPWPAPDYQRYVSPDCTSASERSSFATLSEQRSPHMYHRAPYGTSSDYSQSPMPYATTEAPQGGSYPSQSLPIITGIDPRSVEYEHPEPESVLEDVEDFDVDQPSVCDHGYQAVKLEATPACISYADSGVGRSPRDAESVQFEEQASDSEYTPSLSRSGGKRKRSLGSNSSATRSVRRRNSGRKESTSSASSSAQKGTKKIRRTSNAAKADKETASQPDDRRLFPCPFAGYGCNSTFSSKNEWKRHVSTQHIKLGYWRCDLCPPTKDPNDDSALYFNDFNRKDLFTQHLRRMHAAPKDHSSRSQKGYPVNEDNLSEHQKRCFTVLRTPPQQSKCLFCDRTFDGPTSWDERMDHVGRHLEKDRNCEVDLLDVSTWRVDQSLERYLISEGLVYRDNAQWRIGDGKPKRRSSSDSGEDSEED